MSIEWTLKRDPGAMCVMKWREWNGPAVVEPHSSGFGRLLLERIVPMELGGSAILSFDVSGFSWKLEFPLKEVPDAFVDGGGR